MASATKLILNAQDFGVDMTQAGEEKRSGILANNRFLRSFMETPASDYFDLTNAETKAIYIEYADIAGHIEDHLGLDTALFALKFFAATQPGVAVTSEMFEEHFTFAPIKLTHFLNQIAQTSQVEYLMFLVNEKKISIDTLKDLFAGLPSKTQSFLKQHINDLSEAVVAKPIEAKTHPVRHTAIVLSVLIGMLSLVGVGVGLGVWVRVLQQRSWHSSLARHY